MSVADLVRMANDIGRFFEAGPDRASAVAAIAEHLRRFWDPRMRRQLLAHVQGGGAKAVATGEAGVDGLLDIVREAVLSLQA
jgi:formate dehydrogenase subunit delta